MIIEFDQAVSIYISLQLDKIRGAIKDELRRYDITPADRLTLHKQEDALNQTISLIGGNRPSRQAKELGLPLFMAYIQNPTDTDTYDIYGFGDTPTEAVSCLESSVGTETLDKEGFIIADMIRHSNTPIMVFQSSPQGTPEMIEERKREVANRKAAIAKGEYKRKHGNAPNFRVEGL